MPFLRPKSRTPHPVYDKHVHSMLHKEREKHKSTELKTDLTAPPLLAPQALARRRYHGRLQEVKHLLLALWPADEHLRGWWLLLLRGWWLLLLPTHAPGRPEASAG